MNTSFSCHVPGVGDFTLRPLWLPDDAALLHDWLSQDYARFWGMQQHTRDQVEAFYRDLAASGHAQGWLGSCNGAPAFLLETYDPAHDPVGEHYPVADGDRGMHFLVAPPTRRIPGFTRAVMRTILGFLFADPAARRVVVEPDVRNDKIHPINLAAGFVYQREIQLPTKRAHLAFCTREQYLNALEGQA